MRGAELNLARRPFVNRRPVGRVGAVLWGIGGLLLALNLGLYWDYLSDTRGKRRELREVEARIASESARRAALQGELEGLDLEQQNRHVAFLNARIAERTFPWSRLFDRLGEVLPPAVRLHRLTPRVQAAVPSRRRAGPAPPGERVFLGVEGTARSGEALLELIDALFAHSAFRDPNLGYEAKREGGLVSFRLTVSYLPLAAAAAGDGRTRKEEG